MDGEIFSILHKKNSVKYKPLQTLSQRGYGEEDYSPAPLDQPEQVYFAQNREQACLFWCYASNCRPQEFFLSSFFNVKRGRVSEGGAVSIQFLIVAS